MITGCNKPKPFLDRIRMKQSDRALLSKVAMIMQIYQQVGVLAVLPKNPALANRGVKGWF
jgi:hypothetical protein